MPREAVLTAVLVFVAVALGTVSLALLVEWIQDRLRGRNVIQKLQELSQESFSGEAQGLVRPTSTVGWLDEMAARIPSFHGIIALLQRSGSTWSLQGYLLLTLGLGMAAGAGAMAFAQSALAGLVAFPLGALIPYIVLRQRTAMRQGKLEEQLPEAIDLLGRAMRAGHPLSAGFKMVADEAPEPMATEFRHSFEEQRFGLPFDDSLLGLAGRMGLPDTRILVTAILVHRQVGGNLAEILDNIAGMVRERFKLRRQLRVITAQGRISGYVLGGLPVALGLALAGLSPDYMRPLFTEQVGRYMMVGAVIFQVLGYLWIRKILDIQF